MDPAPGTFRVRGDTIELIPTNIDLNEVIRIELFGDEPKIEASFAKDPSISEKLYHMEAIVTNIFVQLKEDTTEPKWLFWAGDLIREPNQEKPKTTKQIEREKYQKYVDSIVQNLV